MDHNTNHKSPLWRCGFSASVMCLSLVHIRLSVMFHKVSMVALQVHKLKNLLATYEIGENFLLCQLVGWVFLGMFLPIVLLELSVNPPRQTSGEFGKK